MRLTCACVIYFLFFIKVAIIKKKSNLSYLNNNQKPFAYCQIMPALVSADSPESVIRCSKLLCCAIK